MSPNFFALLIEKVSAKIPPENGTISTAAKSSNNNSANIGFEPKLWLAADKLRSNMDAAEYKHVVLGLIFLKYISDAFEETPRQARRRQRRLRRRQSRRSGRIPRRERLLGAARRRAGRYLQNSAKQPTIGKIVDDAMVAIERDNPRLKGVLPKDYARPALDKHRLGELIDLIGTIGLGDKANRSKDILGRVYEYFLSQFASAEGKNGGQFYTPQCVVRLLVEMLAPYKGRVYDPCCGSGGMFVQSEKFVEAHGGKLGDISIYGQESNATTWRLAMMNLAIRGIEADLGPEHADTFRRDLHPDLRADYVLANPPFNDSDWFRKDDDVRWQYGVPPARQRQLRLGAALHPPPRAHTAWPASSSPTAACPPTSPAKARSASAIIEADLVDCMVALPGQLFYQHADPRLPLVPREKQSRERLPRTAASAAATAKAKRSSSMPARWAR